MFFFFYSKCILWLHNDWKLILCTGSYVIIELTSTPLLITGSSGVAHIPSKILIVNFQCSIIVTQECWWMIIYRQTTLLCFFS